jgi:hypothetical protein
MRQSCISRAYEFGTFRKDKKAVFDCMLVLINMHRIQDIISGKGLVKNRLGVVSIALHTSRCY